jgi:hypothetical protein
LLKERGQGEGGRNGFDEHQDYKAKYKGTGSPRRASCAENEAENVIFFWSIFLLIIVIVIQI